MIAVDSRAVLSADKSGHAAAYCSHKEGESEGITHGETYASHKSATVNTKPREIAHIYPKCRYSINRGCQLAQMWQRSLRIAYKVCGVFLLFLKKNPGPGFPSVRWLALTLTPVLSAPLVPHLSFPLSFSLCPLLLCPLCRKWTRLTWAVDEPPRAAWHHAPFGEELSLKTQTRRRDLPGYWRCVLLESGRWARAPLGHIVRLISGRMNSVHSAGLKVQTTVLYCRWKQPSGRLCAPSEAFIWNGNTPSRHRGGMRRIFGAITKVGHGASCCAP